MAEIINQILEVQARNRRALDEVIEDFHRNNYRAWIDAMDYVLG